MPVTQTWKPIRSCTHKEAFAFGSAHTEQVLCGCDPCNARTMHASFACAGTFLGTSGIQSLAEMVHAISSVPSPCQQGSNELKDIQRQAVKSVLSGSDGSTAIAWRS